MYFGYMLLIFLHTLAADNRVVARRVKVDRLPSGMDNFEVLDDNRNSICTEKEKAKEFCAKHGGISVHNTRSCPNNKETLRCRCNSTKSTFLLHEERCVNNENVTRYLHGGSPDCKFHLTVQNSHNPPHCETSPVSTLSTNISDARRFSLCTAHASQEIVSCKIDVNNSLYNKAGRWRRLWRLDPGGQPAGAGERTLESILHKMTSNASRYSGLIVSLQATCQVNSQLNVRLRGQPPYEELQSCLLLKISGSRSWPLKPHQLSFPQSDQMNSELAVNQSRQESNTKIVLETITKPSPKINFSTTVEISTDKIENRAADNASLYKKLIYFMIGAFLCILWTPITIYFVFQCASVRLKNGRRTKSRRRSAGNPTYERGIDTSLTLMPMTAVNLSGSPVSTISPYAHVYQPLVENTRPHSVNGYNNVYESLRGVRDIQELRSFSYSVYQDLSRGCRVTSSGSNYQTMFAPVELTASDSVNSSSACNHVNGPTAVLDSQCDLKTARDTLKPQSETESLDDKECAMEETSGNSLTDRCQSITASTLQKEEEEEAVGIQLVARSSSSLSLSSLKFYEEDDISVDNNPKEIKSDSIVNDILSEEVQQQDETVDIGDKMFSESDTRRGDLHESTSDCRLSGLEIMIDSDCSEYDSALEEVIDETETQSPSQRFYYVLEGP